MATKPVIRRQKPSPPGKRPEEAENARERSELELLWKKYEFDKKTWDQAEQSVQRAQKASAQAQQRQQKGEGELNSIQKRLKRQQERERQEEERRKKPMQDTTADSGGGLSQLGRSAF